MRKGIFVAMAFCLLLLIPLLARAETTADFSEGMSHAEFAKLLVKALHAEGMLPPAATLNDVFSFLENLGVIPPGGWNADAEITKDDLIAILGPKASKDASFKELIDRLLEKLQAIIDAKMGVSSGSSVSPIAPMF